MKYWFNGFLDEIVEGFSKVWVDYKKKKNPQYKEDEKLKSRFRVGIKVILVITFLAILASVLIQTKNIYEININRKG